jgi:integrase
MMGPARTGKGVGAFQFDRVFKGVGRVKKSSGTDNLREFRRRDALLTKLFETSALDVLRAFRDDKITIEDIVQADRAKDPVLSMDRVVLHAPLWAAVEGVAPKVGKSVETRGRFLRAWKSLQQRAELRTDARVGDLVGVDWPELEQGWGKSAADWNHVRRAVSRFLTLYLGDKYHPVRRAIVQRMPLRAEVPRVPDQTADSFLALMNYASAPVRMCCMTVALTGMRVGEYVKADERSLLPARFGVRVNGKSGEGVLYVPPEVWPLIVQTIPCPLGPPLEPGQQVDRSLRYGRLRRGFLAAQRAQKAAMEASGQDISSMQGLRLHDLRHLFGQTASDANVPTADTQAAMRHKDPGQTRVYEMQSGARRAATVVAHALGMSPARKRA